MKIMLTKENKSILTLDHIDRENEKKKKPNIKHIHIINQWKKYFESAKTLKTFISLS